MKRTAPLGPFSNSRHVREIVRDGEHENLSEHQSSSVQAPTIKYGKIRLIQGGRSKYSQDVRNYSANTMKNPAYAVGQAITEALDPSKVPGKVKTLKDMTPEEQARMRALYKRD